MEAEQCRAGPGERALASHIHYYCTSRHAYALGVFVAFWRPRSAKRIRIVPFNCLEAIPALDPGIHIFTDLDRASGRVAAGLPPLANLLEKSGNMVLNHPARARTRYPLLKALHASGFNSFGAHRLTEWRTVRHFPVFIRRAAGHKPALTDLIHDRSALAQIAERLLAAHGEDPDLIIVEFCDVRGADGRFWKYSAFRVGRHDYAAFADASDCWQVKHSPFANGMERETKGGAEDVIAGQAQLEQAWTVAGIGYGRIDYGLVDGRVQVFEVNTNPMIVQVPEAGCPSDSELAARHDAALCGLPSITGAKRATANPLFGDVAKPMSAAQVSRDLLTWGKRHWPAMLEKHRRSSQDQAREGKRASACRQADAQA